MDLDKSPILTHCFANSHSWHSILCLQKKGQFSALTDIDAVKATTAARAKERRIVCEGCDMGSNKSRVNSEKTPFFYVLSIYDDVSILSHQIKWNPLSNR